MNDVTTRPIESLRNWDKNPRAIVQEEFERLKRFITKYGIFKPFVITEDGTVLGGNMRLRACRDLHISGDVPVVIVHPQSEAEKVEIALIDNERAGFYEEDRLRELALTTPDLQIDDFSVDLGDLTSLTELVTNDGPGEGEPPERCPVCDQKLKSKKAYDRIHNT